MMHYQGVCPSDQVHDKRSGDSANLDMLRSCAVLFVVFFHLLLVHQTTPWNLWAIGHWGVIIFFVHTSLVLMCSLERHRGTSLGDTYCDFLIRRAFRIYPLSVATVLVIVILGLPVAHLHAGTFFRVPIDAEVLASDMLLVQNVAGEIR